VEGEKGERRIGREGGERQERTDSRERGKRETGGVVRGKREVGQR